MMVMVIVIIMVVSMMMPIIMKIINVINLLRLFIHHHRLDRIGQAIQIRSAPGFGLG